MKDETGKVKLHHGGNLVDDTAVFKGVCGSLANLILANAAAGAASGALADVGITDRFMKKLATVLISALEHEIRCACKRGGEFLGGDPATTRGRPERPKASQVC